MNVRVEGATASLAAPIASLIMEAMNHECCQNLAGKDHTIEDFRRVMTELVALDDSQYSYRNTLCAFTDDGRLAGICVSYDGGELHRLRRRFIEAAQREFGIDYSDMDDETQAGELYLDSIAVDERYRRQGIAKKLLSATIEKAGRLNIPAVGLLVDKGNPDAERLYTACGFEYVNDSAWGGHPMRHLQVKA